MLTPESLPRLQSALAEAGLDGWLLFDFRAVNPIAGGLLRLEGMVTRRVFAYVPSEGTPVAVTHAIEQVQWANWPRQWKREVYSSWRTLEETLGRLVRGRRVAMEYSPGDAVPYVDRVPAGVLDMVRAAGATVASSGELVTRFYAVWTPAELASHRRAAEAIAGIAREAFARAGLETDHGPNVSVGANAANPHYEPSAERSATIARGDVLLIDLWAREPNGGVYADQTWMASLGAPDKRATAVWTTVRDARDAAIAFLRERLSAGAAVRGGDADDAARAVVVERGFGQYFTHRTGHSIDARDLHGSGPHLDNLETRDERLLIPGVGFSIEPGVYIPGEIGMRCEVNAYVGERELVVTPGEYQRELIVV